MQTIKGIHIMNYKKITKGQARKLFNAGKEIYLHTNKMSWNNPWQNPMPIKFDKEANDSAVDYKKWLDDFCSKNPNAVNSKWIDQFDSIVNNYSYYNCDNERGNVVIYLVATK